MAFVPGYEYDVFVSYASPDDAAMRAGQPGWVKRLKDLVESLLRQKLRRDVAIFIDQGKMKANETVDEQLAASARSSATLLMICSPNYIQSKWCVSECAAFAGGEAGARQRVFPVHCERTEDEPRIRLLPGEFGALRGIRFWKDVDGRSERIGVFTVNDEDQAYFKLVTDLVGQLVDKLNELAEAKRTQTGAPAGASLAAGSSTAAAQSGPTVYLAECTDDLAARRDEVRRYLEQAGARVLPDTWYPRARESFLEAVRRDMGASRLFVQLLSDVPGARGPDLPEGYAALQLDVARQVSLPVMQWRSPDLKLASVSAPEQLALLKLDTVRAECIEDFKLAVQRRLTEPPPRERKAGLGKFFFIDRAEPDEALAKQIVELIGRSGREFAVAGPLRSPDPGEVRQDLEQNLQACDVVVLLYGATSARWVRGRLLEFRKIQATRRAPDGTLRPFEMIVVVEGPPPEKDDFDFMMSGMKKLNARQGLNPGDFDQLMVS